MNNFIKFNIVLFVLSLFSAVSYAIDLHVGLDIGSLSTKVSHSKTSNTYKYCYTENRCTDIKYKEKIEDFDQASGLKNSNDFYTSFQLGADIDVNNNFNVTPYVSYGVAGGINHYDAKTVFQGGGLTGLYRTDTDSRFFYLLGAELQRATLILTKADNGDIVSSPITYSATPAYMLNAGIMYGRFNAKLLYMHQDYKLNDIKYGGKNIEDKRYFEYVKGLYPNKVTKSSVGLSLGLDF